MRLESIRWPRKTWWWLSAGLLVVLILSAPVVSSAVCNTYYNSQVVIDHGDVYCGDVGGTCTECYTVGGDYVNTCWTDGHFTICETANGGFKLY
jgi:hypothetical protein